MSKQKFVAIRNQADSSTLELYFLDIIQDSYDFWSGMVYSKVQEIIDKVNYYKPSKIKCIIDSEGGDAQTGLTIYNFLVRCDAKIEVEIIGLAGSIASVIAMAANKGKLKIARNAFMMIHKAEGVCYGTSTEIRQAADLVDMYTAQVVDVYAQRTAKTVAEINALIENGDYWMSGEECVAQGFADETFNDITPNLQIAARLDTNVYKNIPAQIRAQLKPEQAGPTNNLQEFINNQFMEFKNFFKPIVDAIKGVKPSTDPNVPITNQIAEAVSVPFENLATSIGAEIKKNVDEATGEALVSKVVNKINETPVDFTADGPAKTAITNAVNTAVTAATADFNTRITALQTANDALKLKNEALEVDITAMKGKQTNTPTGGEGGVVTIGKFS